MLDTVLVSGVVGEDLSGIEIRNADGTLIYAKDAPATARNAPTADFTTAVRGGVVSRVTDMRGEKTLVVAAPVTYLGRLRPSGVVTTYLAYDSIEQRTTADMRKLYLILFGGLALFYVLLLPIVGRASNTLRRQAAENEQLAVHDAPTGLPNRTVFRDELESALRRLDSSGAAVVVMVIDLDRFKDVNERLGQHNGDLLLRTVAERVRRAMREVDVVARLGGDEFGVLMPRANASFSQQIATRLRDAIAEAVTLDGTRVVPSASIGIAFAPEHGADVESLLHEAEVAMYAAKERGGGRFRIAEPRRLPADASPTPVPAEPAVPAATAS